ncbi:MAG: DUF2161 domain-containing phosphodiesterase [Roseobacter sp.]
MTQTLREADLYPAIKLLLSAQGYEVKSEIGAADVVAVRADEPPVIVELKLGFSLSLFHQAVARQRVTDAVYIAVEHRPGRRFQKAIKDNCALARRLGVGVMTVRLKDQHVTVHCDPAPYRPRKSVPRERALLREFSRRRGDPNVGGQTRAGLTTAYRQDALVIAAFLSEHGPRQAANVAASTGVGHARRIMADNYYGWFQKVSRGIYDTTPEGEIAAASACAPAAAKAKKII